MSLNLASYLANGYGAEQILEFVEKIFPNISRAAKSAKQTGKSAEEIVRLLSTMNPKQLKDADKKASKLNYDTPLERANASARDDSGNPVMQGAKVLGGALLGAGAARGIPAIAGMMKPKQGLIPSTPYQSTIQPSTKSADFMPTPQSGQAIPSQDAQSLAYNNKPVSAPQMLGQNQQPHLQPKSAGTSQTSLNTSNILSSPAAQPPAPIEQYQADSKKKAESIITELGIDKTLKNVSTTGKNLEQISKEVINSLSDKQKKAYQEKRNKGEAKPMVALLKDYFGNAQGETGIEQPEMSQVMSEPSLEMEAEIEPEKSEKRVSRTEYPTGYYEGSNWKGTGVSKKYPEIEEGNVLEKGSIASTPDGITGEVKSIRNGQALIEDNGKLHKVKASDLQLPDEHIATTVARILEMPEADKSSVLNYWAYDPEDNELFIMYHNGETYRYKDVDNDLVKELEEAASTPKTQGENAFGAWSQEDKQSRGATAIKAIIANPRYKKPKKGEPINPYYRKLKKGYDYWSRLRK